MNASKLLKFLPIAISLSVQSALAVDMVGSDLLTYFSSTCRSQGDYTRRAISDAQSLITILENVKNDEDCLSVSGGISQLYNLQRKLHQIDSSSGLEIEIEKLAAQESELSLQLSATSDQYVKEQLESAIRYVQVERASAVSQLSGRNEYGAEKVRDLYSSLVNSADSAFNSIASNHRCLNKNPNILPAITSMTGAIASAAIIVNPALGLGIAAATDFIGNTLESLRQSKYNKLIRKISDNSLALEGYKCVLESLSDRWCSLEDAKSFLDLKMSVIRQKPDKSDLNSIFRLNDREIPVLLEWLERVKTGVPATTVADAERQQEVITREAIVKSADSLGNGVISQNRLLYDLSISDEDKYSVIKSVAAALTNQNCSGGYSTSSSSDVSNPLFDIYPQSLSAYKLLGLDEIPRDGYSEISFCNFNPFTQWPAGAYTPDYAAVKTRYFEWVEKANNRVNREKALVFQPDALLVLSKAYERSGRKIKITVMDAITNITNFLVKFKPEYFVSYSFNTIYEDTIAKLKELKTAVEDGIKDDAAARTALEKVLSIAKLQHGVIVFQSRLEMIVRVSISDYLKSINTADSNVAQQLLAADSYLDTLRKVKGDDYTLISTDIHKARPIAEGNMRSFIEIFGKNINSILEDNDDKISDTNDPTLIEIYRRNSAELCLLLSSMPVWPDKVDKDYCVGSQLDSVIPTGPRSPILTENYLKQNFSERSCGYRNYLRKSKIFQEWNINF